MNNVQSERISKTITEFIMRDSYWGYLFSKLSRKEDLSIETVAVSPEIDGTLSLLYNPNFVELTDSEFLNFIIEHEGIHILNNHIPRMLKIISDEIDKNKKSEKSERWGIAADCSTNTLIGKSKKNYRLLNGEQFDLELPEIYNLPNKETAEFYYVNLPNQNSNDNGQTKKNVGIYGKEGNGKNIDDHSQWSKNNSKVSDIGALASRIQQYTQGIVLESYSNVRNKGKLPGFMSEMIENLLKPPQIPYYQMITKLVKGTRLAKTKRAYTRINKKRVYSFFLNDTHLPMISPFPGRTKDYTFNISILLDTSGSMSKKDILEGLSGVKHIIENDKDCKTIVIENDAIVQKEYEIKKLSDIQFNINGRGGTELAPGLLRCRELKTDVTVVFTDGFTDNINRVDRKFIPKKIIYVITNNGVIDKLDKTGFIVRLPN